PPQDRPAGPVAVQIAASQMPMQLSAIKALVSSEQPISRTVVIPLSQALEVAVENWENTQLAGRSRGDGNRRTSADHVSRGIQDARTGGHCLLDHAGGYGQRFCGPLPVCADSPATQCRRA